MKKTLIKDSEVEVCSKEEGFHNAWFRAILIDNPRGSRSKKLRVRYMTLLEENGSSPLIEFVEQRFIRPVPPDNLYDGVVLEEGSVVDVYQRDGWWTGLVIKKLEDDKFLISFDSPPDVIQAERKQLRLHLDLIRSKWVRPDIKELSQSMFSPGTIVEVSSVKTVLDKVEVVWVSAMVIKEFEDSGEKKFIVKEGYKHLSCHGDEPCLNMVVDSRCVRPTPPPFTVDEYTLLECVEAFRGSGWHQGLVRKILPGKRYRVMLEATKEEAVFKDSDLRPFKVWENGVWHNRPKAAGEVGKKKTGAVITNKTPVVIHPKPKVTSIAKESVSLVTSSPIIAATPLKQTEAETQDKTVPKKTIQPMTNNTPVAVMTNKTSVVHPKPKVTSIAKESVSLGTSSPIRSATTLKQTEAETQDKTVPKKTIQPMTNNTPVAVMTNKTPVVHPKPKVTSIAKETVSLVTSSPIISATPLKQTEAEIQDKTLPKKTIQPMRNQNGLGNGSTQEKKNSEDKNRKRKREQDGSYVANVKETNADDTTMVLPFEKKLPVWETLESMEVFKTVPQAPCFSPLVKPTEISREIFAVGLMVTYNELLKEVKDLQLCSPISTFDRLNDYFAELEKHGIDVKAPQMRIQNLLSVKDKQDKKMEELQGVKRDIAEKENDNVEIKNKIRELQRREEEAAKEIAQMKSSATTISQQLEDVKLQFQTIVSAPWK